MKTHMIFLLCLLLGGTMQAEEYLKQVLKNLEQIRSASYLDYIKVWEPGDTVPLIAQANLMKEWDNPQDTTLGVKFMWFDGKADSSFHAGYDGEIYAFIDNDEKMVGIDDFSTNRLPFRPIGSPFFNWGKNLIRYILETPDSITTEVRETGKEYFVRLTIHEDTQVEFFGRAHHMPEVPPEFYVEPTSVYELWIDKTTDLPYKIRREMSHNISLHACSEVKLNGLRPEEFDLRSYFPEGYEVRKKGERVAPDPARELEGKPAPLWTLRDVDGKEWSLSALKGKVVLLNLTGIGCGACHASIPFLRTLGGRFASTDFALVAIETWGRNQHSIRNYINRNKINYPFLEGVPDIVKDYQTGGAAPAFFLIDRNGVVKKVFRGYSLEKSDRELTEAIENLLHE